MRPAITLPDELLQQADRLASDLGLSRAELLSLAVRRYVQSRGQPDVTERMNTALERAGDGDESSEFRRRATTRVADRHPW